MELTPLLIYESFLLAIGVAAVCAFSYFYFRLLKGYNKLHAEYTKLHSGLDEYGNSLSQASKEHLQKLVLHSNELSDQLKAELTKLLQAQAQKESGAYREVIRDVGEALEKESKVQVQEFADGLSKELTESEEEIRVKIAKLYDSAQIEVEKMRADAKQEIQAQKIRATSELREHIYAIIGEVIRATTGRLLSKQDEEGIVLEQLEKSLQSSGLDTP